MSQSWSHATNSLEKLHQAMQDRTILSIEADILMGHANNNNNDDDDDNNNNNQSSTKDMKSSCNDVDIMEPIMSHPPHRSSDLTVSTFLSMVCSKTITNQNNISESNVLQKHIKLDFKELSAVQPTLEQIVVEKSISNPLQKNIYLNADILPGPGKRIDSNHVDAESFMTICLDYIDKCKDTDLCFIFSLGYKCDYNNKQGYTDDDVTAMDAIIQQYQLQNQEFVLALNARQIYQNIAIFDTILQNYSKSRILAWTGTGEPSIAISQINAIQQHYTNSNNSNRIEFDCSINE